MNENVSVMGHFSTEPSDLCDSIDIQSTLLSEISLMLEPLTLPSTRKPPTTLIDRSS